MGGAAVRHASRKVSATREIAMGAVLGLMGGIAWRAWHLSYKAGVDEYYDKYDKQRKEKMAQQEQ